MAPRLLLLMACMLPCRLLPSVALVYNPSRRRQSLKFDYYSHTGGNPTYIVTNNDAKERQTTLRMIINNDKDDDPNQTNPRRRGFLLRRITGDGTPYEFPIRRMEFNKRWPLEVPFTNYAFSRLNPISDGLFYMIPRLVYHMDEPAVAALTQFYRRRIPAGSDILDLCSSWVSHYPLEFPTVMKSIAATGINPVELALNDQLTAGYTVVDLNREAVPLLLPFPDSSLDVITCACSFDYLTQPIEVLQECRRTLRPGGTMIISFSNRCFVTKAVRIWLATQSQMHHLLDLLNSYFQCSGGWKAQRQAYNITACCHWDRKQDPLFVVEAVKQA